MPQKNNPFKPTHPVAKGIFAGRTHEINRIRTVLEETKNGNPTNLLVVGERGIGKTSLLLVARCLASGDIVHNEQRFDFMTTVVSLDKRTSVGELARKINTAMERQLRSSNKAMQYMKDTWRFIQRLEIMGTKIAAECNHACDAEIFESLTYSIADVAKAITCRKSAVSQLGLIRPKDGLVIFIDEADSAPDQLDLGALVKQLSERLRIEGANKVLLVLAGLPNVRNVLLRSHISALRLFEELELTPLSGEDVKSVIRNGLEAANAMQSTPVKITEDALDLIVGFSEGYPHFVQQFGYSSYSLDKDNLIDHQDVTDAALSKGGAFDLIGDRYYKDMYFNKIKKDAYRQVLQIMSEKWNEWISKDDIRSKFRGNKTTLDNAIRVLADRNIILRKPGKRGEYRLQWAGFAFWIKYFTKGFSISIPSVVKPDEIMRHCLDQAFEFYASMEKA